jgi:hypothetical protein
LTLIYQKFDIMTISKWFHPNPDLEYRLCEPSPAPHGVQGEAKVDTTHVTSCLPAGRGSSQ